MFAYIKKYYHLPWLKRGMEVLLNERKGHITWAHGAHLYIRFEGEKHSSICHPTWQMVYYDEDGEVLADYREEKT